MPDNVAGFGDVTIELDEYKKDFKPTLEKAAQLIVTHPDIEDDAAEMANRLNLMSVFMDQHLTNQVPQVTALERELEKVKGQLQNVQNTNAKLSSQVYQSIQAATKKADEKGKEDEIMPWDQITAKMMAL